MYIKDFSNQIYNTPHLHNIINMNPLLAGVTKSLK